MTDVIDYFDGYFAIGLSPSEKDDLAVYLEAIDGGTHQQPPKTNGPIHLANAVMLLTSTSTHKDGFLTRPVTNQVHVELSLLRRAPDAPSADTLTNLIRALRAVEPHVTLGAWDDARGAPANFADVVATKSPGARCADAET